MEESACLRQAEQGLLAVCSLGEIRYVVDDGSNVASKLFLQAQRVHPRSTVLAWPREIVGKEQAEISPVGVSDLPHSHVRVPDRHIRASVERQAEQAACDVECRLDHSIEL